MQHGTSNTEEDLLVKAILEETPWEKLPKRLKLTLIPSNDEYHKRVKEYCIKKRLRWNECAARHACRENDYYDDLIRYLRKNLGLFPYHLSENVCRILRTTPFRYYNGMLYDVMRNEQPYDSIPNFTAADVLRLTGIGRNEFIDIMNKCRAKLMWKLNKSIVKEMLPTQPVDFRMEPWWVVSFVNLTTDEYRKLSEEEMAIISGDGNNSDRLGKEGVNLVGEVDIDVVRSLYRRGLVYLEVPVYPDDHFQVSTLEGFVSNRNQQYEDPTEELLYAVFVASSEQTTVAELAQTLQANPEQLQSAVALASRLGWAKKYLDPASFLQDTGIPESPRSVAGDDRLLSPFNSPSRVAPSEPSDLDSVRAHAGLTRFAFMVDANLTSYLMMGSLSPGLKGHAVTLYEAGKLGDSSVTEMCEDLQQVEGTKMEGELQQFADHAFSLRHALECLRSQDSTMEAAEEEAGDFSGFLLDAYSPGDGDDELLLQSGQQPLQQSADVARFADATAKATTAVTPGGVTDATFTSRLLSTISLGERISSRDDILQSRKPAFRVDVIRIESLQDLAPATMQRVLQRDYDVVVSMIPLPSPPSVSLPDALGPVHFGPPSRACISPWMKLLLYQTAGSGPVSVALLKGQRFRILPPPLAGCAKALLWTWDGTGVNGLGGKFEGTLVEGNVLLHCVNAVLKYNALLIQPLSKSYLDCAGSGKPVERNVPLPLCESGENSEWPPVHASIVQATKELALHTCAGYIRLLEVPQGGGKEGWVPQSVELGVPLFNTELCKSVCRGVIQARLFSSSSLVEHRRAMRKLRLRLQDFILDYQAAGSVASSAYAVAAQELDRPVLLHSGSSGFSRPRVVPGEEDLSDVPLPGVNLIFDGTSLQPLHVDRCLQGRLPARLVVAASTATGALRAVY